jgi:tetratricopeptide (TPR) repeat protein
MFLVCYDRNFEEALDLIERAEKLDPLELQVKTHRGSVYCFQNRFDEAVLLFQNLVTLEPYFALGHYWLGCSYTYNGLYDKAVNEFEKAIKIGGRTVFHLGMLGFTYARAGNRTKAEEVLKELERRSKEGSGSSWMARVYAALGKIDKVFEWLEKAYEQHDPSLTYIAGSLELEIVRSDPRFKTILKKMGISKLKTDSSNPELSVK